MNKQLDEVFRNWLAKLATEWNLPIEQVALSIGDEEIGNRIQNYPKVYSALVKKPFDIKYFANAARECWVLSGQYVAMRFNMFVNRGNEATTVINALIENFPEDEENARKRIQDFLESAVLLGFSTPKNTFDWAGAARLASLILTILHPSRFVDYSKKHWRALAEAFSYELPLPKASPGEWVIWAGKFAAEICETKTYQEYWPTSDPYFKPLWVISGITWEIPPRKAVPDPVDPDYLSFPEGAEKRRLHLTRERNRALISKAKALGLERDPALKCEVCDFSFIEEYGERGKGFIEAHHKQPIAELKAGSRTRVEDIVLVCANCHRMLHTGDRTLSVEELRKLLVC